MPGLAGMHDVDVYPQARTIPGLVVYRYDAQDLLVRLKAFGLAAKIGQDQLFPTLPNAPSPPTSGGPPSRDSAQARNQANLASLPEAPPAHPATAGHNTAVCDGFTLRRGRIETLVKARGNGDYGPAHRASAIRT